MNLKEEAFPPKGGKWSGSDPGLLREGQHCSESHGRGVWEDGLPPRKMVQGKQFYCRKPGLSKGEKGKTRKGNIFQKQLFLFFFTVVVNWMCQSWRVFLEMNIYVSEL